MSKLSYNPFKFHKMKDSRLIKISDMSKTHIINTIKMFNCYKDKGLYPYSRLIEVISELTALEEELAYREDTEILNEIYDSKMDYYD